MSESTAALQAEVQPEPEPEPEEVLPNGIPTVVYLFTTATIGETGTEAVVEFFVKMDYSENADIKDHSSSS